LLTMSSSSILQAWWNTAVEFHMLVESDAGADLGDDRGQSVLPDLEGIAAEIVPVQLDQIEGVQQHGAVIAALARLLVSVAKSTMPLSAVPQRNRADEHRRLSRARGLGCHLLNLSPSQT
jgi:hypothetical protein